MSTVSVTNLKHASATVDNIKLDSGGGISVGGVDATTLPAFIDHAFEVQNGGGIGIHSANAGDNRWIFFGNGTSSGDVQRAGIVNQGSDQSLGLATAGTQRLRIDSSGRVTMPYQPCCSAYHSGNIVYNGSLSPIAFNSARFNVGNHFNTSTGTFTAPVAGKYLVTTYIHWMDDAAYTFQYLRIQVASTNVGVELMRQGTKGGYDVFGGTHIVSVSANDTIRVVMGNAGIDAGYSRGGSDFNTFEVYLLG
jgi:hypothetical protein